MNNDTVVLRLLIDLQSELEAKRAEVVALNQHVNEVEQRKAELLEELAAARDEVAELSAELLEANQSASESPSGAHRRDQVEADDPAPDTSTDSDGEIAAPPED